MEYFIEDYYVFEIPPGSGVPSEILNNGECGCFYFPSVQVAIFSSNERVNMASKGKLLRVLTV